MTSISTSIAIGYTGTRKGMAVRQLWELRKRILARQGSRGIYEAHHGDCIGGDAEFHELVDHLRQVGSLSPWPRMVVHPCVPDGQRAYCHIDSRYDIEIPGKPPIVRNHDIVDSVREMFATPGEFKERKIGSGTWATIRYAKKTGKPLTIIYPDGTIEEFNYADQSLALPILPQ